MVLTALQQCAVTKLISTSQALQNQCVRFDIAADQDHLDGPSFVGDGPGHAMQHSDMPKTESLQDTVKRILPLWHDSIAPAITSGQKVLIFAHGNSIRVSIVMQSAHCCILQGLFSMDSFPELLFYKSLLLLLGSC